MLLNEEEVLGAVRRRLPEYTVRIFHTKRSFLLDAPKFSSASIVAGPHGGAFSNVIFCKQGTLVAEMNVSERSFFYNFAQEIGLRYHRYGRVKYEGESFYLTNFTVDAKDYANDLYNALKKEK
tara:strand:- start:488 stop:856 length:369 start_codon:yes stop_codon:yes gene_type:complete